MTFKMLAALMPFMILAQGIPLASREEAAKIHLKSDVNIEAGPTLMALTAVLRSANLSGGLITQSGCLAAAQRSLTLPEGYALSDALEVIVSLDQAHNWTVKDGVVNLLPKVGNPDVMQTVVPRFEWDTGASIHLTVGRLFGTDDVRRSLAKSGLVRGPEYGGLYRPPHIVNGVAEPPPPGEHMAVEGLNLLAILNAVVASYGESFWWYEERTCGDERIFDINARTPAG